MILTIALDPILESKYYVRDLYPRRDNRAEKVLYNLSGKGLVFARILRSLNIDVFSTGFLGGLKGNYIFDQLKKEKIYNDFIFAKEDTRGNLILIQDGEMVTRILDNGPRITRDELASFYELFNQVSDKFEIVCGLGPLPQGVPEEIYYDLIDLTNKKDKKFILDAKGKELSYGIKAGPFMVIVDRGDLEDISRLKLDFENEIIKVGKSILEEGIDLVIVDLDQYGSLVLGQDQGYRVSVPGMESIRLDRDNGYLAAGYIFGMDKGYEFETTIKIAQGFRFAYAIEGNLDMINMNHIKRIMSEIEISPIFY